MREEQLKILQMVESGQIGAEEAAELLSALEMAEADVQEEAPTSKQDPGMLPRSSAWAHFWIYPLMVGAVILIIGGLIVGLVYSIGAARGWLLCGWLPILLGLTVILLALWTRHARWLHLRISEGNERKMALSIPLPLTLAAWVLKVAQPFVPQLRDTGVDDLIIALRDSATRDEPLFIDVQDDEEGERVELYIG